MGRPFALPEPLRLEQQDGQTFPYLVQLMRRLLAEDGCPWDREQSIPSLKKYVLEEACEVMDAIESGDRASLAEELGDLALQVVFIAELARREASFGPDDVVRGIVEKLVRRHPHVFEDESCQTPEDVERNWARIKSEEKRKRPLLDDIPRSLPALAAAMRMSERVATVGFDWPNRDGSRAKVEEELAEIDEALQFGDQAAIEHEVGDLLLAVVNYSRHLGVDPERALHKTLGRFRQRFNHVEESVRQRHGDWPRVDGKPTAGVALEEMEAAWQEAKGRLG